MAGGAWPPAPFPQQPFSASEEEQARWTRAGHDGATPAQVDAGRGVVAEDQVVLSGLVSRPGLNGAIGVVQPRATGRTQATAAV